MSRRDTFLLILLLAALVLGIWLIVNLKTLAHLLLIVFLAASG